MEALCRWCRARKFDKGKVVSLIKQAGELRRQHAVDYEIEGDANHDNSSYDNANACLGVPESLFLQLYPQGYWGTGKGGEVVFFSKVGDIQVQALMTCLTFDSMVRYHWNAMLKVFPQRLRLSGLEEHGCICVIDLQGLKLSDVNKRTLKIFSTTSTIDQVCYPETMFKTVIINAPRTFNVAWKMIKGMGILDKRTVQKIEIVSSSERGNRRLRELITHDTLPEDYGGGGISSTRELRKVCEGEGFVKRVTRLLKSPKSQLSEFEVPSGQEVDVIVYTKESSSCTFVVSVVESDKSERVVSNVSVSGSGYGNGAEVDSTPSSSTYIVGTSSRIRGPSKFKVLARGAGGSFVSRSKEYLMVVNYKRVDVGDVDIYSKAFIPSLSSPPLPASLSSSSSRPSSSVEARRVAEGVKIKVESEGDTGSVRSELMERQGSGNGTPGSNGKRRGKRDKL